ncbi:Tex-like N-terminal domain-containing protein [Bulleidia sp. zg-1006]|uniref:Tex-like N-terminal domain-containing protein n=1 Tax=Bulleidia sp. zg-1006 TaxID=2806552 RepID=UPI001939FBD4|nr:Tex family protein [Bulleidia sp. zg-1006]QRG86561.1 RNA-binding transcriptional accessory protein [Bulleidia sp. zg-1006]
MNEQIIQNIAKELQIQLEQVEHSLSLLQEGNTVPFIARYRKEATKGLDEEQIFFIQKQFDYQNKLAERKEAVLKLIAEQGKLTPELEKEVKACEKLSQVEDVYRPYAQKKKTRATEAVKKGLQPLADWLLALPVEASVEQAAEKFVNENVPSVEEALQGARDIIAEFVSDKAKQRWRFKEFILTSGQLQTRLKKDAKDEKRTYEMYYDRSEKISYVADHRVMAMDRAEKEKVITVSFVYDKDYLEKEALEELLKGEKTVAQEQLALASKDGCERLLFPSIEREIRSDLSERAQGKSIEIFSMNLEKLLSQAPLKGRVVLGFDPGYFNGCKLAVIDETGKLLTVQKIFPFSKKGEDVETSKKKLLTLMQKYQVQIVAIGNGTASRESEKLVADVIRENQLDIAYAIVSEAGASVWSAQEEARLEFPDLAVEERSAVSIGRRLLDPLAELIKIDPQSIGVGQYQHDLPQKKLSERLEEATMKVVNRTGADLNTASKELLTHISGLNAGIAQEIVNYRNENGRFTNRKQLLKVKKLGPKAYTQSAGFLRIKGGEEPLDQTSIHPESYEAARKVMEAYGITQLGQEDIVIDGSKDKNLGIDAYTLKDIEEAIRQPLRDYRDQFDGALLKSDVLSLEDLHVGDRLSGTVRNVVDFGAFIDIGLHEDGLAHISHMAMKKFKHPSEILSVGDIVTVWVYAIDTNRERVQLSLLPLDKLQERDAQVKYRKSSKHHKPKKKEVTMEDALSRLTARFKKH